MHRNDCNILTSIATYREQFQLAQPAKHTKVFLTTFYIDSYHITPSHILISSRKKTLKKLLLSSHFHRFHTSEHTSVHRYSLPTIPNLTYCCVSVHYKLLHTKISILSSVLVKLHLKNEVTVFASYIS